MRISASASANIPSIRQLASELVARTRAPIEIEHSSSKLFEAAIDPNGPSASSVDVRKLQRAHLSSHRSESELAIAWAKMGHAMKPTGQHNVLFLDLPSRQFFAQPLGPEGKDVKGPFRLTPELLRALERDMSTQLTRSKEAMRYRDD